MQLSLRSRSLKTRRILMARWVNADDGTTFDVTNPVNGELITAVASVGRLKQPAP